MNISKHHKLTNEVYTEVLEVFKTLSEPFHHQHFPANKLPLALKALAMEPPTPETIRRSEEMEGVDLKEFLRIISDQYVDHPQWCSMALNDSFAIFDKDGNGYLDATELKRVFTKLGEELTDMEMEDQVREYDIDGDKNVVLTEYMKMVLGTRGADFVFDDA